MYLAFKVEERETMNEVIKNLNLRKKPVQYILKLLVPLTVPIVKQTRKSRKRKEFTLKAVLTQ